MLTRLAVSMNMETESGAMLGSTTVFSIRMAAEVQPFAKKYCRNTPAMPMVKLDC